MLLLGDFGAGGAELVLCQSLRASFGVADGLQNPRATAFAVLDSDPWPAEAHSVVALWAPVCVAVCRQVRPVDAQSSGAGRRRCVVWCSYVGWVVESHTQTWAISQRPWSGHYVGKRVCTPPLGLRPTLSSPGLLDAVRSCEDVAVRC